MKLAVAGKGGSGKTSFSGTIARDGHSVIPIDGDSNPNLVVTLGIAPERMRDMPTLPSDLLRRTEKGIADHRLQGAHLPQPDRLRTDDRDRDLRPRRRAKDQSGALTLNSSG